MNMVKAFMINPGARVVKYTRLILSTFVRLSKEIDELFVLAIYHAY